MLPVGLMLLIDISSVWITTSLLNPRWNLVMRSIYDLIGLPNVGDYGVILGKAYLRLLPGWTVFATYFVLGHRSPYARG